MKAEKEKSGKRLTDRIERSRPKGKNYSMDLRVHSPASLGYIGVEGLDSAPALVRLARVKGLDVIAVTDYYTGEFIDRMKVAAENSDLTIIPGVTLRTKLDKCDDVVLTCLFPENFSTTRISEFLIALSVAEEAKGDMNYIVKAPFHEILETIDSFGGVAIPSRMDKTPHRLQVIPALIERYGFRAFDVAYSDSAELFKAKWPQYKFQLFSFSAANALAQVGSRMARIKMESPGFVGIKDIMQREAGI